MKPEDLYGEIVAFCKSNTDEAIIKKYSKYFKGGQYDAYGLPQHLLQNKITDILNRSGIDFQIIRETSRLLVRGTKFEEVSIAFMFYKSFIKTFDKSTFSDLTIWFESGIHNWAHTDSISGDLLFYLLNKKIISYSDFRPWIKGQNKFQRRAVPVSLIKTLKYTKEFQSYFKLIEPLMTDPEREVHQGVGWFLREAWKLQPEQTEIFLLKWKDISPRLIYQYACEKMSQEQKNRFKRTK